VRYNTEASVDLLREGGFDALVLCTGARPQVPPVEGIDLPHVVQAVDLLWNPAVAEGAERPVVVGGGDVGCEVAHFLACECGKTVTVIEMLPYFMKDSCTANRGYLIHYLEEKGVVLWNCTQLLRVDEHGVTVARNVSPSVPSPYVTWAAVLPENVVNPLARPIRLQEEEVAIPADLVVLAVGMEADDGLYAACVSERVAPEIHNVGDSFTPARIFEATKAGHALGRAL
jgi:2-enoate reductase